MGLSLAITTYNRPAMTIDSFAGIYNDSRIDEIVIVDDVSTQTNYEELKDLIKIWPKVKLFRNQTNLGCYHNKRRAVELCSNDWVILFDSDNQISADYLNAYDAALEGDQPIPNNVIFAPAFAMPHFDYRAFQGEIITKRNVREKAEIKSFDCLINTCNFIVNREEYLKVWEDHPEPWTADTLFFNYCWLKSGGEIFVVPNMHYQHLVHDGSHYKENVRKTGNFAEETMDKLKNL